MHTVKDTLLLLAKLGTEMQFVTVSCAAADTKELHNIKLDCKQAVCLSKFIPWVVSASGCNLPADTM